MALLKAACLGGIAALGIPYVMRDSPGALAGFVRHWTTRTMVGGHEIHFSLAIFLAVTLFSWAMFGWSNK